MADIFISYARADEDIVQRLAAALEAQGWSVFWDRTIPAGQTWRSHIGKALADARCVIVAWSDDSIDSHWVHEEADDARTRNVLIPVLLTPVIPPIGFRSINAANLIGWDGDAGSESFARLRTDASRLLGDPPALIEARESQRVEAEREAAEREEKRRAEAKHKAREQEARQRKEAERVAEEKKRHAAATGANGNVGESKTPEPETADSNPLRLWMTVALVAVIGITGAVMVDIWMNRAVLPIPELLQIPAGTFMMGSEDRDSDERPVRQVRIGEPFYLGATEVTFEQYDAFAEATGRELPSDAGWGREDRPVINVGWEDATAYAEWLGEQTRNSCRLPSEAEWEYAARAGTRTQFALPAPDGSNDLSGFANCGTCGSSKHVSAELNEHIGARTLPVGSFPENNWDLHDMHGNVWEWVQDCWHDSYEGAPDDGSVWLEESGRNCGLRVLRGGSWDGLQDVARSAFRNRYDPDVRDGFVGFRVLCSSPIIDR